MLNIEPVDLDLAAVRPEGGGGRGRDGRPRLGGDGPPGGDAAAQRRRRRPCAARRGDGALDDGGGRGSPRL